MTYSNKLPHIIIGAFILFFLLRLTGLISLSVFDLLIYIQIIGGFGFSLFFIGKGKPLFLFFSAFFFLTGITFFLFESFSSAASSSCATWRPISGCTAPARRSRRRSWSTIAAGTSRRRSSASHSGRKASNRQRRPRSRIGH